MLSMMQNRWKSGSLVVLGIGLSLLCSCDEQQKQINRFRDWQEGDQQALLAKKGSADDKTAPVKKAEPRMKPPSTKSDLPKAYKDLLEERKTQKPKPAREQGWLKPSALDLGTHRAGSSVKGRYEFKNPTGKEMTIQNIASSCTCQSLVLVLSDRRVPVRKGIFKPVLVAAGAKGYLEFQVEANDTVRNVYVTLFTSDPENPQITVAAKITGVRDFQVQKGEREVRDYHLGLMKRKESRDIEVRVKSTNGKPFEIIGHEPFPDGLELEATKDPKDPSAWWLRGSYRVSDKAGANVGGKVVYKTDRSLGFDFDITAMVLAPIRVLPKTVQSLSGVPEGESRSATWTLVGIDADTLVQAEKTWFELDPNSKEKLAGKISEDEFVVDSKSLEGGKQLSVTVKTPSRLPPGLLMGNVLVQFKNKALAPLSLRLMVQVRRARR